MALEDLVGPDKFISNLVNSNPTGTDVKAEGDDHIRGVKNTLVNTFPSCTAAMIESLTASQMKMAAVDVILKNDKALLSRDGGDAADVNLIKLDAGDVVLAGNLASNLVAQAASVPQANVASIVGFFGVQDQNIFAGQVNSGGGGALPAGWSAVRDVAGIYTVTHNLALTMNSDLIPMVTVEAATAFGIVIGSHGLNSFQVRIFNQSNVAADAPFRFICFRTAF